MEIWTWLNGKKTVIAVILYLIHKCLLEVVAGIFLVDTDLFWQITETIMWAYQILGTVGVGHKLVK